MRAASLGSRKDGRMPQRAGQSSRHRAAELPASTPPTSAAAPQMEATRPGRSPKAPAAVHAAPRAPTANPRNEPEATARPDVAGSAADEEQTDTSDEDDGDAELGSALRAALSPPSAAPAAAGTDLRTD